MRSKGKRVQKYLGQTSDSDTGLIPLKGQSVGSLSRTSWGSSERFVQAFKEAKSRDFSLETSHVGQKLSSPITFTMLGPWLMVSPTFNSMFLTWML